MKLESVILFVVIYFFSFQSFSSSGSGYQVCPNISTGYLADIRIDRTIIINYEASSDYFVALRCGYEQTQQLNSSGRENNCHVYRSASRSDLCQREQRISKVTSFLSSVLEGAVNAAATGGVSALDKARTAISAIRSVQMQPECLGISLLKNIATGNNIENSLQVYYDTIVELRPFTGLVRYLNDDSEIGKNRLVFDTLDGLLIGDNGSRRIASRGDSNEGEKIRLRGPAYIVSQRNQSQTDLLVDEEDKAGLCTKFPDIVSDEE